jgi:hypothetical protein
MGCPDDDDPVAPGDPDVAAAEAAIEEVLDNVVDPLLLAIEAVSAYLDTLDKSVTRATCPDTSTACSPGSLSCSPTTLGWDFAFAACTLVGTSPAVTADGGIEVSATGVGSFTMALEGLSINGSNAMNGVVTFADECNSTWNITSANAYLIGEFIACSEQDPQPGSDLIVQIQDVGEWLIDFDFDGSSTATALVMVDMTPVATCTVNLDTFNANCSSPGI